jgi:PTS system nitrogen regulatory IIA component
MDDLKEYPTQMRTRQVAEVLQVSEQTIRRWIADGTLPAFRVRGEYRIPREVIERMIDEAMR